MDKDNIDELTKLKNIKKLYLESITDDLDLYELCTQAECYIKNIIYDPTGTIITKNDCEDIKSELFKETRILSNFVCEMNDIGEVTKLSLINDDLIFSENTLKNVFKSTITDLTYTISGSKTYDYDVNFYVNNIKNLEKFIFDYDCYGEGARGRYQYIRPLNTDALKAITKVKEFTLKHIAISQDNIDELSKFENLQRMEFSLCEMNGLNLDTLCSKSKCYINGEEVVPDVATTNSIKTTTAIVKTTTTTTTTVSKPTTTSYSSLRYYGTDSSKYPLGVSKLGNISKITLNEKNQYNNWFSTGTKITFLHLSDSTTEEAGKPSGYCLDVNTSSKDDKGNYYLEVVTCSEVKHKFRYIKDPNSKNTTNIMIYNVDNTIFKDIEGNNLCLYYATNPTTHPCGKTKNNSSLGWKRTLGDIVSI